MTLSEINDTKKQSVPATHNKGENEKSCYYVDFVCHRAVARDLDAAVMRVPL